MNNQLSVLLLMMNNTWYECAICIEPYFNPVVLPCGHSFCKKCIENQPNSRSCPTCLNPLPYDFLQRLPINYPLRDAVENYISQRSEKRCDTHAEELKLYCRSCTQFVCNTCVSLSHRDDSHQIILVQEAIQQQRDRLLSIQRNITEEVELQQDDFNRMAQCVRQCDEKIGEYLSLKGSYEASMKVSKSRIDQLQSKLDSIRSRLDERADLHWLEDSFLISFSQETNYDQFGQGPPGPLVGSSNSFSLSRNYHPFYSPYANWITPSSISQPRLSIEPLQSGLPRHNGENNLPPPSSFSSSDSDRGSPLSDNESHPSTTASMNYSSSSQENSNITSSDKPLPSQPSRKNPSKQNGISGTVDEFVPVVKTKRKKRTKKQPAKNVLECYMREYQLDEQQAKADLRQKRNWKTVPCQRGSSCTFEGCSFYHPSDFIRPGNYFCLGCFDCFPDPETRKLHNCPDPYWG